ncbi:MAG: hypothetical protein GX410_06460, partial [Elusimicrobia bacterium]|nr:hypothetical protein [Elusimicrobiota bacterium]
AVTLLSLVATERQGVKTVPIKLQLRDRLSVRIDFTQWNAGFSSKTIPVP